MKRSALRGAAWLSVLCAPLSIATAAAFFTGLAVLHDVARVLRRGEVVRQQVAAAAAALVAETALAGSIESNVAIAEHMGGQFTSAVERHPEGWLVRVHSADGERWFESRELAGAAPELLGCSRSVAVAERGADASGMPRLAAAALARAQPAEQSLAFVRDRGLALLHLPVGTDREDFTLGSGCEHVSFDAVGELVVVPGHLWIEAAPTPLLLQIERDTVIVVQGNLYLDRSVRLHGGGRLVVMTAVAEGACTFGDLDGDGRWSVGERVHGAAPFRGPVEGSGSVWIGGRGGGEALAVDLGLVVAGELMLSRSATVGGPLVIAHGVTATRAACALQPSAPWTFRTDRERVPGFVTAGRPRPGRLHDVGASRPREPFGRDANQPLYLAAPTR